MLKANLTLDLSRKKRLSTSFAKEDGKKIMTGRIEWKKGNEKVGQHIDLQLPCVSNHVKRGVPCDQSLGRMIANTSSCCSGEFRKLWIRSGFEGPPHRDLRMTALPLIWPDEGALTCPASDQHRKLALIILFHPLEGYGTIKQPVPLCQTNGKNAE